MDELSKSDEAVFEQVSLADRLPAETFDRPNGLGSVGDAALCAIDDELRADVAVRLQGAILEMEAFLKRSEGIAHADPTRALGQILIHEARELLRGALSDSRLLVLESTLRSAYRLCGSLRTLAAWGAPASQESHAVNSYPVAAARSGVTYSRYGSAAITAQEHSYGSMLGFEPAHARLLLTSSGMAAYALIEAFLLRDVLKPADHILVHPDVYFETRQQLQSLPFFDTRTARGGSRADMLADIAAYRPKAVFVDPLSNSAHMRAIDIPRLLDEAEPLCAHETWFIVDSTLLSGSFDPFRGTRRSKVRVLYYESGCKYLQFGMDLGPSGLVVVDPAQAARFEQLRRGLGAIGYDGLVLPRASRSAYLKYLRLQTASATAAARAVTDAARTGRRSAVEARFPTEGSHADSNELRHYAHLGGIVVFRFADAHLNARAPLEKFIDLLIAAARQRRLALTAGVSFGFRCPRIGAAWSSYDAEEAFLRLSAGVDAGLAAALGGLIVHCADEFIGRGAR